MSKVSTGAYTCPKCGKRVKSGHKKYGSPVKCELPSVLILDEGGLYLDQQVLVDGAKIGPRRVNAGGKIQ